MQYTGNFQIKCDIIPSFAEKKIVGTYTNRITEVVLTCTHNLYVLEPSFTNKNGVRGSILHGRNYDASRSSYHNIIIS